MLEIVLLNSDFEEMESTFIQMPILNAIEMADKISEFTVDTKEGRLRFEKTGWIAVDFKENRVEIQLKTE